MTTGEFASCLYRGAVAHSRLKPRRHRLRYRVFSLLFALDELDRLDEGHRLFSHNRFNLFSFYDRDHGNGTDEPLTAQIGRLMAEAGLDYDGGRIALLCMPRLLGYVFNPISVYFCHRRNGDLMAILYEVNNTFGQRHSYLIPVTDPSARLVRQRCDKRLYVSPFIDMGMTYDFKVVPPADDIVLSVVCRDPEGPLLVASLVGQRRALSDRRLLGLFFAYPLITLKVVAGIHWEALKLWLKGMKLRDRPPPPAHPVTVVPLPIDKL